MRLESIPDLKRIAAAADAPGVRFGIAAATFMARFREMLVPLSLTPSRVLALTFLSENPGCDQTSLAGVMRVNRASAMLLVDKFEAIGYVERKAGADRRSNALFLTETGRTALRAAQKVEAFLNQEVFGSLKVDQIAAFLQIVDEIFERSTALGDVPPGAVGEAVAVEGAGRRV